jgi:hypothetical protein
MGLFGFIETFFFISLGITFVLILLLVYHFKQRITVIEKKCDTMFEIINNVVQELTNLRSHQMMANRIQVGVPSSEFLASKFSTKPIEELDEEESDDEDDDDVSEYEDDDESTKNDPTSDDEEDDEMDSGNELMPLEEFPLEEGTIKVINVENLDRIEVAELNEVQEQQESDAGTAEDLDTVDNLDIVDNLDTVDNLETVDNLDENIQVQKLEEEHLETSDENSTPSENSKEVYRKMNLGSLKTLVITKGLCTDPSKMKKNELLKLLESNE